MKTYADHVIFAGGGTAGHLFPGLAVADELRASCPQVSVSFAGSGKAFEIERVRASGYEYTAIAARPFPRKAIEALRFVTDNFSGYYAARRLLRAKNVSLVVGLGGYSSVPPVRAAARLGIPYILLEQNAVPGRATRWLAPGAAMICSAFEEMRPRLRAGSRVRVTGNPLRRQFGGAGASSDEPAPRIGRPRRLVVLGGTSGSQTLNRQVPMALYKAGPVIHDWQIVHQTGEHNAAATGLLYRKLGLRATVAPFFDNLPEVLRTSDLAISRSGGTTLAELATSRLPAILLPYPQASDNHQRANADAFTAVGAAKTLDERETTGRLDNHLAAAIVELAGDPGRRGRMSAAIATLARPDATHDVARSIATLLEFRELATV